MRITNDGDVRIGPSGLGREPFEQLDVRGNIAIPTSSDPSINGSMIRGVPVSIAADKSKIPAAIEFRRDNTNSTGEEGRIIFRATEVPADLAPERMVIQGNGNVGIGTTAPTTAAAPNGQTTGNLDVNDVWLRGANGGSGAWASEAGGAVFGGYTEVDTNSNTLVDGATYLAQADGLLTAFHGGRTSRAYVDKVKANVDSQNFTYLRIAGTAGQFVNGMYGGVTVPVAKNEYVRIAASDNNGGEKIGWMPFGSGGLVRQ